MKKKLLATLVALVILGSHAAVLFAATADISVRASSLSVQEGSTVVATVSVTSPVSINDVEASLSYPADILSVQSFSTAGSVFSIWAEQPVFSNTSGSFSFNGGVPDPGYTGTGGKVIDVVFYAKRSGSATIAFSSGTAYANDGLGTDVTGSRNGVTVTVTAKQQQQQNEAETVPTPAPKPVQASSLPPAPAVTSKDMPDESAWYSSDTATFSWVIPSGVTAVQLLRGSFPDSLPTVTYAPAVSHKTIPDMGDGIWYLHVRFRNSRGWGPVTHRVIRIDSAEPAQLAVSVEGNETGEPALKISAHDALSGIAKISVSEGDRVIVEQPASDESRIVMQGLSAGTHTLSVRAFDAAGNSRVESVIVAVVPSEVLSVDAVPKTASSTDLLTVSGSFVPGRAVAVIAESPDGTRRSIETVTDAAGRFSVVLPAFGSSGMARIAAEGSAANGSIVHSETQTVVLKASLSGMTRAAYARMRSVANAQPVPLLTFVFTLLVILVFSIRWLVRLVSFVAGRRKTEEANTHRVFQILRRDVELLGDIFEKNHPRERWTEKEQQIFADVAGDIDEAERYFEQTGPARKRQPKKQ